MWVAVTNIHIYIHTNTPAQALIDCSQVHSAQLYSFDHMHQCVMIWTICSLHSTYGAHPCWEVVRQREAVPCHITTYVFFDNMSWSLTPQTSVTESLFITICRMCPCKLPFYIGAFVYFIGLCCGGFRVARPNPTQMHVAGCVAGPDRRRLADLWDPGWLLDDHELPEGLLVLS